MGSLIEFVPKDIIRCLTRFVAREIYNAWIADHQARVEFAKRRLKFESAELLTCRGANAMAGALNGRFEAELVTLHGPWRTRHQLEIAVIECIDRYEHRRSWRFESRRPR